MMKYICPLCGKAIDHTDNSCDKISQWFQYLKGKGLWRVRYLNQYEYVFLTENDFVSLQADEYIILDEANHWKDFDPVSFSGINSLGERTSIFLKH